MQDIVLRNVHFRSNFWIIKRDVVIETIFIVQRIHADLRRSQKFPFDVFPVNVAPAISERLAT